MSSPVRRALLVLSLAVVALLVRGPLHRATFGLPVSNDDAIPLLMARHLLRGELSTVLWNQPYNGALDAYLIAPLLAVASSHHAFRVYEAACAVLLALLVFLLARRVAGEPAGVAAAFLAVIGTPYMGLMTATGPPPNFLMPLVTGFPLLAGLRLCGREGRAAALEWALLGIGCGLAVWNSSLAIPAFAGMAAGLLAAGRRTGAWLLPFAVGAALGAIPLLVARLIGASGSAVVTAASAVTAVRGPAAWIAGLSDLAYAGAGLVGLQVPLVVDGPERQPLPWLVQLALGLALGGLALAGALRRDAWPLAGWLLALAGAFALSRRTGPDELRYLYGLHAPLLALLGIGLVTAWRRARPVAVVGALAILLPWLYGHRVLAATWRDPAHAARVWQVPPLGPVLDTLERAKVASAYASLQFAGRLSLESDERVLASQAWNERIPADPLRFRDEVDLDPRPAWVLSPHLSRGMPRAGRFREILKAIGGSAREDLAGDFVIFRSFKPPYDEARPVPAAAVAVADLGGAPLPPAVLDRDGATVWTSTVGLHPGAGIEVRLREPRALDAFVLLVDLEDSPLAAPWVAEVDGQIVERGPARYGFQWVNGAPRAARQALLAVRLGGGRGGSVRLIFQGAGPRLRVGEVFLYGPDEEAREAAGSDAAAAALAAARSGRWADAVTRYAEAVRLEPERASHHAALARARWRASRRQRLDVESLTDGLGAAP
jgi:hypothetical protein